MGNVFDAHGSLRATDSNYTVRIAPPDSFPLQTSTETDLWECLQRICFGRYRFLLECQLVSIADTDFGLETNEFCQGRPGSVRFGYGLEMERFKWFRFSVPAVPLQKGFFCISVQFNRKGRFRFRFRFLENGSSGSGSAFGFGKNGSDGSGFRFRFGF